LKIVLVHYHLRTGGVTRVMRDQAAALAGRAQVMIVSGEPAPGPMPCPVALVPALAYDRDRAGAVDPRAAARDIVAAVRATWADGASLYHFHNPTLGKNRASSAIVRALQEAGESVLLQIHDFAEDGRPELYAPDPYPADCHYAAINGRDTRALVSAGLEQGGVHYLPNAVRPLAAPARSGRGAVLLYPVRAIRRKNIGEAVLLSCFLDRGSHIAVTLEPTGPLDRGSCDGWKSFAAGRGLPVRFGAGIERGLDELLAEARGVITTSIKEGFGFAFLEPWTAGLPVYGRWLDETCPDFADAGVRLEHLYRSIEVPVGWVDSGALAARRRRCREAALAAYGLEGREAGHAPRDTVDFGLLSEDLQQQIVAVVLDDPGRRAALAERNPWIVTAGEVPMPGDVVADNQRVVLEQFSLEATARRLAGVYERVLTAPIRQTVDKRALARAFNRRNPSLLLCPSSLS
jgi:hypothetical protein